MFIQRCAWDSWKRGVSLTTQLVGAAKLAFYSPGCLPTIRSVREMVAQGCIISLVGNWQPARLVDIGIVTMFGEYFAISWFLLRRSQLLPGSFCSSSFFSLLAIQSGVDFCILGV